MQFNIFHILFIIILLIVIFVFLYHYMQNRPYKCPKCFRSILTKNKCVVSASLEDYSKDQSLCQNCIRPYIENGFKFFKYKAIMIHPDPNNNAYQFYNFAKCHLYGMDENYISKLRLALPPDNQRCENCNNTANFSWYGKDFFKNKQYLTEIELNGPKKMLCGSCLASAFITMLEINKINLGQFIAPYDGDGLGTPWDY